MVCEIRENFLEIKLFGTFVIKVFVYVTFVTKLLEQKHLGKSHSEEFFSFYKKYQNRFSSNERNVTFTTTQPSPKLGNF